MMTKEEWLKEATKLFKAGGSKIPAVRAAALLGQASISLMSDPAKVVAQDLEDNPYGE